MTRPLPFLLLLILAALSGPASAARDDATAIMRLVAAHEARVHATDGAHRACILPETFVASGTLAADIYRWQRPSAPPSASWTDNVPLPPDEARALTEAVRGIPRGRGQARRVARVDPAWLPGYAFCAADRGGPVLGFSAPLVRGELAFVETGFTCGGLCGNGLLYALRRGRNGWAIVGVARTWVS